MKYGGSSLPKALKFIMLLHIFGFVVSPMKKTLASSF